MPHILFPRNTDCNPRYTFYKCSSADANFFSGCCKDTFACDHGCKMEDIDQRSPFTQAVAAASSSNQSVTKTVVIGTQFITVQSTTTTTPARATSKPTASASASFSISLAATLETLSSGSSTLLGDPSAQPTSKATPTSEPGSPTSTSTTLPATTRTSGFISNLGPIIGGVIAGLFLFLLPLLLFVLYRRRRAKKNLKLAEVPYTAVKSKPRSFDSSSNVTVSAHEKRKTDYYSTLSTPSIGVTPSSPNLPSELPGPINIAPPPATYAQLPDNISTSPPRFRSPIKHPASTSSSIYSLVSGQASTKSSPNAPHIMSWATFEDGLGGRTQTTSFPQSSLQTLSESVCGDGSSERVERAKLQEWVKGPNGEPDWSAMGKSSQAIEEEPNVAVVAGS